jgi:CHAD domain-containing protein
LGRELRWLLGHLGPARDRDVLATDLLPPLLEARGGDPALLAMRDTIEAKRGAAQAGLREILASQRYADLALELAAWVERRGWREGADIDARLQQREEIAGFAAGVLRRRHKQVAKRGRGFERLEPEARHRLRIALKKLRYGMDFFAGLFPGKRVEAFRKTVARMQDRLGHLNDVAVASRLVHELVDPLPPGPAATAAALGGGQLVGWYAHQVAALEPETVEAWKAFRALEPFWDDERRQARGAGADDPGPGHQHEGRLRQDDRRDQPRVAFASGGLATALADVDRQKSSLDWLAARPGTASPIRPLDWRKDAGDVPRACSAWSSTARPRCAWARSTT